MEMLKENAMNQLLNMELSSDDLQALQKKIEEKRMTDLESNFKKSNSALTKLQKQFEILKEDNRKISEELNKTNEEVKEIKDKTMTIEFDDPKQLREITNLAKRRMITLFGGDLSSPQYKLLFKPCLIGLYGNIKTTFGINKIGKIKNEKDLITSVKTIISVYNLDKKIIKNKLSQFQKEIDKGNAKEEVILNFEDTLEWCNENLY